MNNYIINDNGAIRNMTKEEIAKLQKGVPIELQIQSLKSQLAETDYKAIKYAEGWITEEEYATIKAERQAIRNEINKLELEKPTNV